MVATPTEHSDFDNLGVYDIDTSHVDCSSPGVGVFDVQCGFKTHFVGGPVTIVIKDVCT
jgi:hypothetical protein